MKNVSKKRYKRYEKLVLKKGFTLLELLVVVSIIGILMAMGFVAYSTAQKRGRDAKRRGDVKSMQDGFEQWYGANSYSYAACGIMDNDLTIFPNGLPTDPKGGSWPAYVCAGAAPGFCICADVESDDGNNNNNDCSTPVSSNGDFYCLANLQ